MENEKNQKNKEREIEEELKIKKDEKDTVGPSQDGIAKPIKGSLTPEKK